MIRLVCRCIAAVVVVSMAACGGNDDSGDLIDRVAIAAQDIQAVTVDGAVDVISVGDDVQLQLLAASISGTSTITQRARWTTSDPTIATITERGGVLTGVGVGSVEVRGVYGPFANSVNVRVSSSVLESLEITAPQTQFNECLAQQLKASGTYEGDGTDIRNLTESVEWQITSGTDLGSFNASVDPPGFLRTIGDGAIAVSASQNGITQTLALEVLPALERGGIEIDEPAELISVGTALVYTATANFSDGSQNVDISDNAMWELTVNEGTSQFATVSNTVPSKGTVTATQAGGGTLRVSCGGVTAEREVRAEQPPRVERVFITPDVSDGVFEVDVDDNTVTLGGIVRFVDGTQLDVTEESDWTVTVDSNVRALELSNSSGSRGVITINGVGTIEVIMEYRYDGIPYRSTLTVESKNL